MSHHSSDNKLNILLPGNIFGWFVVGLLLLTVYMMAYYLFVCPQMRFNLRRSFRLLTTKACGYFDCDIYIFTTTFFPCDVDLTNVYFTFFGGLFGKIYISIVCFNVKVDMFLHLVSRKYFAEWLWKSFFVSSMVQKMPR